MIREFDLTEDEQQDTIASGAPRISNRTGWAMSHLKKGALIEMVANHAYRATDKGLAYLKKHKGPITPSDLRQIEGWKEAWNSASKENKGKVPPIGPRPFVHPPNVTPEELIDGAVDNLRENLRDELLDQLSRIDPFRFERVVMDLLFAMGYGGSRAEAAKVTKKSGDEGIDGIINEDRLGLDVIYVQAKRWKGTVGRPEIQTFVGALAGKQAQKGVFITTSDFASGALDYAAAVPQKVILINGSRLAALMIEHGIGVATTRTVAIQRIDSDYFEDE
jgi:restriction system protein